MEQAYQGRAMFVKVSCKAGESPVELSHHPELWFRLIPRPHDGAPLIANAAGAFGVQVTVDLVAAARTIPTGRLQGASRRQYLRRTARHRTGPSKTASLRRRRSELRVL